MKKSKQLLIVGLHDANNYLVSNVKYLSILRDPNPDRLETEVNNLILREGLALVITAEITKQYVRTVKTVLE